MGDNRSATSGPHSMVLGRSNSGLADPSIDLADRGRPIADTGAPAR